MAFKDRLIELRKSKGLSQVQLAEKLHISPGAIGNYEAGTRIPQRKLIFELSDYFHVAPEYLLYGSLLTKKQFDMLYSKIEGPLFYLNADDIEAVGLNESIRQSIASAHKYGQTIRFDRAEDLAQIFNVDLNSIMNDPDLAEDDLPEFIDREEMQLVSIYRNLSTPLKTMLLDYAGYLSKKNE